MLFLFTEPSRPGPSAQPQRLSHGNRADHTKRAFQPSDQDHGLGHQLVTNHLTLACRKANKFARTKEGAEERLIGDERKSSQTLGVFFLGGGWSKGPLHGMTTGKTTKKIICPSKWESYPWSGILINPHLLLLADFGAPAPPPPSFTSQKVPSSL